MGYAKGMLRRCVSAQMSGDLEFAMIALLDCATRPAEFFADRAYRAMKVRQSYPLPAREVSLGVIVCRAWELLTLT